MIAGPGVARGDLVPPDLPVPAGLRVIPLATAAGSGACDRAAAGGSLLAAFGICAALAVPDATADVLAQAGLSDEELRAAAGDARRQGCSVSSGRPINAAPGLPINTR